MKNVKSYTDYDGCRVKIGDTIAKVSTLSGKTGEVMGKVEAIFKGGFYVHPVTSKTKHHEELWGKFTRKVSDT